MPILSLFCFQVVNAQPSTIQYSVGVMPESYMGLSIFTCLCCCWLFGLIAIMYSSQVSSCLHAMEPPIRGPQRGGQPSAKDPLQCIKIKD